MNEKLRLDILSTGCKCAKQAAVAAQVYIELCEVRKYHNVQYFYEENLDNLYITAFKSKSCTEKSYFVPIPACTELSLNNLLRFTSLSSDNVYIAIVEADSTTVYYKLSNGLLLTAPSENKKENKTLKRDAELKKIKPMIEHAALCGLSVNLPGSCKPAIE